MNAAVRCRLLTPPGEAAIAVFELSGDGLAAELAARFRPFGAAALPADGLRVGRFDFGDGVAETGVVRLRRGAEGGIVAEVAAHGSPALAARVARLWPAPPAPPAGLDAEAEEALGAAFADLQIRFLCAAPAALAAEAAAVRDALRAGRRDEAARRTAALLAAAPAGRATAAPPVAVLIGPVNAGKSSLFNALLGAERALVSDEPGTTRDVVEEPLAVRGRPFLLRDAAGIRDASDPVEREGVARAAAVAALASVRLRVFDAARTAGEQGADLRPPRPGDVLVVARCDLARPDGVAAEWSRRGEPFVAVSVRTGEGLDALAAALLRASPFRDGPVAAAPFTARQESLLAETAAAIAAADDDAAFRALAAFCGRTPSA